MENVLERDAMEREELLRIFFSLVSLLKMENLKQNFDALLGIEYSDCIGVVEDHMKQLKDKHCPIVIAGKNNQID